DGMEGFVAFFDQALAARQKGVSRLGQRDAPRGAVEQAGLQPLFETRHLAADVGGRYPQLFGGAHEAATLGNGDELVETFPAIHIGFLLRASDYPWGATMFPRLAH